MRGHRRCPECSWLCEHHQEECKFGAKIEPQFQLVVDRLYEWRNDTSNYDALREVHHGMSQLIACAEALRAPEWTPGMVPAVTEENANGVEA